MIELRGKLHYNEAPEEIQKLWKWYALKLMAKVAKKGWNWESKEMRCHRLFSDCVAHGDECLMLQLLLLRGERYLYEKYEDMEREVPVPKKRGRKKVVEDQSWTHGLSDRGDIFTHLRKRVISIKANNLNDKFGWENVIRQEAIKEYWNGKKITKCSKSKKKSYLDKMVINEIPV